MNILEIAKTKIRGEDAIKFPLKLDFGGWVSDANGNHVLDIRGWGHIQYAEGNKGAEIQDGIAEWVVKSLNEAWEKENKK